MELDRSGVDWQSLKPGVFLLGLDARGPVEVVASSPIPGTESFNVVYRRADGSTGIFVADGATKDVRILERSRRWTFDGDSELFRLVTEAQRIRYAYLFDPLLAVHTSLVVPLPHQITAVYQEMLTRQPLRYLLADDPGAGKTIMTGLLVRELIARGDLQRCLIVAPGALVEQWQDELESKFHLRFAILTTDQLEASGGARWFEDHPLAIARLDKLSRDDDLRERLRHVTPWDLIVVDEAHKMSATLFGSEVKRTKRYQLGQLLVGLARHVLLLTATPHNGKEADFQLFLSLLDPDRFEGKYRDEHGRLDHRELADIMRRLVKEDLLKFDGDHLFPKRRASTVGFDLSPLERKLYDEVTAYVRDQFNRAERLDSDRRRGNVGFALTVLQRRLASSTAAIAASLTRRRERLEKRLRALEKAQPLPDTWVDPEDLEEIDDLPEGEADEIVEQVVDEATAAQTADELRAEIEILKQLEALAQRVRRDPDSDRKWRELAKILGDTETMTDRQGHRRKFVIFTEHRDTLDYLYQRLRALRGRHDAIVTIHGGMHRQARKAAEDAFRNDPNVEILVATDAAGEGINLQRAHLMANYDLPWNPNRIEQRFGRIHRIGQKEVCHLWNLLALDTREGDVFAQLFEKLERQREVLGDGVFDILGMLFRNQPLRELLMEAIRYGESPDAKSHVGQTLRSLLDIERARELMRERALAADTMDWRQVQEIRADMERAEARRLQPHFIRSFFLEGFRRLGGSYRKAESGRYELTHVPAELRSHANVLSSVTLPRRYERVAFDKDSLEGPPPAEFLCPGHPLLDAVVDLVLRKFGYVCREGAVLVDPADLGMTPRMLIVFESTVQDARTSRAGRNEVVSRELHFVELQADGRSRMAGYAPHLDYRPPSDDERSRLTTLLGDWRDTDAEHRAQAYALEHLLPRQQAEVQDRVHERVARARAAVRERLTKEIIFHEARAAELQAQERAGKQIKLNWQREQAWSEELRERLKLRLEDLDNQERLTALPPRLLACAFVLPAGLFAASQSQSDPAARAVVEQLAMQAVMEAERALGFQPRDVSEENLGYDVESAIPNSGKLRFIEIKGRDALAPVVTITKKEILTGLNKPDDFILALVPVQPNQTPRAKYLRRPFVKEPDFGATSVNYDFDELLARASDPS
jgi:SNF2 family DNA or RNA helicase